ncbi:ribonuclease D [Trueperella bialowiezensis]|uniref:Ribonuclease D n=1 Tax=Trueperella bialowiezensis TaxID=312285 RepID=A0A3S4WF56_9ACTO|nr:HRDC domain-containing protein [Trueperella bialowiezensis]VEI12500.1 Ribonuclease D [Trueperella bialowiezensis]
MTYDLPPVLIEEPREGIPDVTHSDIDDAVARLARGHGPFAVDTERAMGIRYSNRAYLIQVRRPGAGTVLIDPVGIEDRLDGLREVMREEWILHSADQDLPSLHELGLTPTKVFDTEIAALILGYERHSLQAITEKLTGWTLAKEHSNSDWSQRPLPSELRAYAALDVELLHELRHKLTDQLVAAGRMSWFEQECEEVRTRTPKPPRKDPWRRYAHRVGILDRRALGMLRELWDARDALARERDVAPSKVISSTVLAELAESKPRSWSAIENSPLLEADDGLEDAKTWWKAIRTAWALDPHDLPQRKLTDKKTPHPPVNRWETMDPDAFDRWQVLRTTVLDLAEELGIRQEVLIKPAIQRMAAWEGWHTIDDLGAILRREGARPWQIDQVSGPIHQAAQEAGVVL